LATRTGRPGDLTCWTEQRNRIYDQVMARGYDRARGTFVQAYDENVLDAALLAMPAVGFVTPSDPLWQSTLGAIERELVSDSLVHRYDPAHSHDGLPGHEGTFNMCTFWYVEALARSGRLDDARLTFEKMFTPRSHAYCWCRSKICRPSIGCARSGSSARCSARSACRCWSRAQARLRSMTSSRCCSP
jgi:GH15 family glucan-1,4-alpha-glucosidase